MSDVGDEDYTINGKKFAVVMVLDVSGSMSSQIQALEDNFNRFIDYAKEDKDIRQTMDLALITFGSDVKDEFDGFTDIKGVPHIQLKTRGSTNMSDALRMANQMARDRTRTYRNTGIEAYKPWIILMTDGYPDDEISTRAIASEIRNREKDEKVHAFALGMGTGFNKSILEEMTNKCFAITDWDFEMFFSWLGKSVAQVSKSTPGASGLLCDIGEECQTMGKFFDNL